MAYIMRALHPVWIGMGRVGLFLWNVILTPSPYAPVQLFYHICPVLIVWLYFSSPASAAGLEALAQTTRLPWYFPVLLFTFCAVAGSLTQNSKIHAVLVLPMAFYALAILVNSFNGRTAVGGLITALYMTVSAWSALALIRYYQELLTFKRGAIALESKVESQAKELADWRSGKKTRIEGLS